MNQNGKTASALSEQMESKIFSKDRKGRTWKLLLDAAHVVMKVREKELSKYNISGIRSVVLVLIQATDGTLTPAQLARQTHRDPHSVSELLARMEEEGLIEKVKDLPKKNQVRVVLTPKGLEAYHKTIKRESIHNIISILSPAEQKQMNSYLKRIRDYAIQSLRYIGIF
jgi:DNA-binding MarR family transcriptional regulator